MRQKYIYLYILFLAGISCETEPEICVGFSSTPVIYTIFDRSDTISHIYVARSFSGNPNGPMINAKIFDSIYYDNVSIQAELLFAGKEHDEIISYHEWEPAVEEQVINRNPGIFSNPIGRRYTIFRDLDSCYYARLSIYIPSFDTIKLKTPIIPPPIMDYPQVDGSYITLHRTKTLPISWYGYAWNELKVEIEIETAIQGSHTIIDTLTFWKNNIVFPDDPKSNHYVSIFSFESYLKLLDTQLSRVNNVKFS
jgi:hypothetical protein